MYKISNPKIPKIYRAILKSSKSEIFHFEILQLFLCVGNLQNVCWKLPKSLQKYFKNWKNSPKIPTKKIENVLKKPSKRSRSFVKIFFVIFWKITSQKSFQNVPEKCFNDFFKSFKNPHKIHKINHQNLLKKFF